MLKNLVENYKGSIILEYWGDDKIFVSTADDPLGFFVDEDDVATLLGMDIYTVVMESGRAMWSPRV